MDRRLRSSIILRKRSPSRARHHQGNNGGRTSKRKKSSSIGGTASAKSGIACMVSKNLKSWLKQLSGPVGGINSKDGMATHAACVNNIQRRAFWRGRAWRRAAGAIFGMHQHGAAAKAKQQAERAQRQTACASKRRANGWDEKQ